jgi:hypothetical protein
MSGRLWLLVASLLESLVQLGFRTMRSCLFLPNSIRQHGNQQAQQAAWAQ